MTILRQDQAELDAAIDQSFNHGAKNALAVLPTGAGKSIIMRQRVARYNALGAIQTMIAHRTELVSQLSIHIATEGVKHRLIAPKAVVSQVTAEHRRVFGRSYLNPDANCAVGGIDTIISRTEQLRQWFAQNDYWYGDEAHHFLALNKWGRGVALFPNARGLGVTASPRRADGMGLGRHHDGVFDDMVQGPDMRTLINIGALCDYEIVCPETDFEIGEDLPPGGDFTTAKMKEASEKSHIVGDTVQNYVRYAYGKRGICFATDVETAQKIAANFNAIGVPAACVSAETPTDVRNDYIRRFRAGSIWMLVNVDLFGEGFDVPAVEVVIMARPTASLAVYLQQFGRALRVMAGKLYGLVIDQVYNFKRHGFPDKPHYWSLDRRDKRAKKEKSPEEIELTACRGCSKPYMRCLPACPHCGQEPPLPAGGVRTLKEVDGDLILLDRAQLEAMRLAVMLPSPAAAALNGGAISPGIGAAHANRAIERHASQQRLQLAIERWGTTQRDLGRSDRESHRRFYLTTGVDVLSALGLPRPDMDALATKVEGWYGG